MTDSIFKPKKTSAQTCSLTIRVPVELHARIDAIRAHAAAHNAVFPLQEMIVQGLHDLCNAAEHEIARAAASANTSEDCTS